MSVAEDRYGNLWAGGYNEGITVFYWKDDSTTTFKPSSKDTCSVGQGPIFDLNLDSRGDIWVGTYMGACRGMIPKINVLLVSEMTRRMISRSMEMIFVP